MSLPVDGVLSARCRPVSASLLAEGHAVTAVAHRCGFASASAFIDVFRRNLGHTPGRYAGAAS